MAEKFWTIIMALVGLLGATFASTAAATTVSDIQVTINGTASANTTVYKNSADTLSWVNIAGSYNFGTYTITISPKCTAGSPPDNLARVEAGDDSADDVLALKNAKITISSIPSPAPEHLITFWGTFDKPPVTNNSLDQRAAYRLDGSNNKNSFTRGLNGASGNSVRVRGAVKFPNNETGTWWPIEDATYIELNTADFSSGVKNFFHNPYLIEKNWDSSTSPNNLTGPRVVKGDFWFKFTNTSDILAMPQTCGQPGYVLIKSIPAFIPPPGDVGRHK